MKMTLDFVPRRLRFTVTGALLLAGGLIAAGISIQQYREAQREIVALESELGTLVRSAGVTDNAGSVDLEQLRARIVLVNQVVRKKTVPWDGLFRDIEQASDSKIGLLAIQPEVASGQVRISGEARDAAALSAYIMRLEKQPSLQTVHLVEHEIRTEQGRPVLRFNLNAIWVPAPS